MASGVCPVPGLPKRCVREVCRPRGLNRGRQERLKNQRSFTIRSVPNSGVFPDWARWRRPHGAEAQESRLQQRSEDFASDGSLLSKVRSLEPCFRFRVAFRKALWLKYSLDTKMYGRKRNCREPKRVQLAPETSMTTPAPPDKWDWQGSTVNSEPEALRQQRTLIPNAGKKPGSILQLIAVDVTSFPGAASLDPAS